MAPSPAVVIRINITSDHQLLHVFGQDGLVQSRVGARAIRSLDEEGAALEKIQ